LSDVKRSLYCARCGFADYRALEFHHEGAQDKEFNLADMVRRAHSREHILKEIAKCAVLCSNCHRITHAGERPEPARADAALPASDTAGRRPRLPAARRVCRYCLVEQDESCFEVCKTLGGRVYRRHKCRACKRATQRRRKDRLLAALEALKKTLRCTECGFGDPRAFEFHHPEGKKKAFAVGDMVKDNRSLGAIEREIAKCVVLCANCHRIAHFSERK
jgi:hypothetical protein